MVPPFEDLQIGAAGQRGFDTHPYFAFLKRRGGYLLDTDVFFSMKDSGFHGRWLWTQPLLKKSKKRTRSRPRCVEERGWRTIQDDFARWSVVACSGTALPSITALQLG
jgi:hypothetical protein